MALDADNQRGMDADTHSDVVDIDDGSDTEFESPQTLNLILRSFNDEMRRLVRTKLMRVHYRRRQGNCIQVQGAIEPLAEKEVWHVLNP